MPFKDLLASWSDQLPPVTTRESYAVHLSLDDAARIHALAELHPGTDVEHIITDLLTVALDELQAAIPYVPGETVIREDDHGDPVYEDVGMTPRFLELTREHKQNLEF